MLDNSNKHITATRSKTLPQAKPRIKSIAPVFINRTFNQLVTAFINDSEKSYECHPKENTYKINSFLYGAFEHQGRRVDIHMHRVKAGEDQIFIIKANSSTIHCFKLVDNKPISIDTPRTKIDLQQELPAEQRALVAQALAQIKTPGMIDRGEGDFIVIDEGNHPIDIKFTHHIMARPSKQSGIAFDFIMPSSIAKGATSTIHDVFTVHLIKNEDGDAIDYLIKQKRSQHDETHQYSNRKLAKRVHKEKVSCAIQEINIAEKLDYMKVKHCMYGPKGRLYIIMHRFEEGDLIKKIEELNSKVMGDDERRQQRIELARAVLTEFVKLHDDYGIVHRDIKTDNIFVESNGVPRFGDFSMSIFTKDEKTPREALCGSLGYINPALFYQKDPIIDRSADIFAMTRVIAQIFGGPEALFNFDKKSGANWYEQVVNSTSDYFVDLKKQYINDSQADNGFMLNLIELLDLISSDPSSCNAVKFLKLFDGFIDSQQNASSLTVS